ncbi:MAG: hypothetical protein AAF587_06210 [Bacteroidota bacterium]
MKNRTLFVIIFVQFTLFFSHGYSQKVGIATEEPTETLDVNGSIRIREGAGSGLVLISDSAGAASWSPLSSAWDKYMICVTDYGAISEDGEDDTQAFITALDSAAAIGAKVCVPPGIFQLSSTLSIPAGVIMEGTNPGHDPLIAPYKGSVLEYAGSDWAIKMSQSNAGLRDLAIRDASGQAKGGLYIMAETHLVESLQFSRIQVYGFVNGTGIFLGGKNQKGVAYASFYDIRVRNAKIGIEINPEASGFANANSFYHGVISGGGFDYCLLVKGGTRNEFIGTVMEPYSTNKSHLKVEGGHIVGRGIWIEGSQQPKDRPLIEFAEETSGSTVEGAYAGGLIINRGSNTIKFSSSNSLVESDPGYNLIENPFFLGVSGNDIPSWFFTDPGIAVQVQDPELLPNFHVLKLSIPPGKRVFFGPENNSLPQAMGLSRDSYANFGGYVKTDHSHFAFVTLNADQGMITSIPHRADNEWQFVGLRGKSPAGAITPRFFFDNSAGTDSAVVYVSCPTFSFGNNLPILEAKPITSAGGVFNGVITQGMEEVVTPANHFLVLPKKGNLFQLSGIDYIARINHHGPDRFPKGTVITLLFENEGITILNTVYIQMVGSFQSTENSSLSLVSLGNGTWRELGRNL